MVFNSHEFILIFLPLTFLVFLAAYRYAGWKGAFTTLGIASMVFYAQLSWQLLAILMVSIFSNYVIGNVMIRSKKDGQASTKLLVVGIVGNLIALGYFKYTNFFIDIANQLTGGGYSHLSIILPIGISFYTFVQIGYLVEAYQGQAEAHPFGRYVTFAAFFPYVTAGPLVLQREIFEQMEDRDDSPLDFSRIAAGLTIFTMGLFKKVVLADSIAPYANTTFNGVADGQAIGMATAWLGSVAYTFQLYFDFSGYSDMAIGLGAIFGLMLPLNFNSPFKATNISDFWQRWHMTMTRFFTTYVYQPMAIKGMRKAVANQYEPGKKYLVSGGWPIVFTMLVAGIWHGSGWVFILYGLLHGIAIAVCNGWRQFQMPALPPVAGWLLTMSVVISGLAVFRSPDVGTATTMLASMWGLSALQSGSDGFVTLAVMDLGPLIVLLSAIVLLAPNTQEIISGKWLSTSPKPMQYSKLSEKINWQPNLAWSAVIGVTFVLAFSNIGSNSSFLYYQF